MNIFLFLFLGTNLLATRVKATLQRDVLTYINVFRHMHASGPLLVDDVVQKAAENAANTYMKENSKDKVPIYRYSANFCKYTGPEATLDRTCVISWYITMKYFSWCYPKAEGQALPFVNMIWKASTRAGVGIAKGSGGTYFVVVYITLLDANNVRENVPPLKVVMEASDKADCPTGYSRLKTSCFKYVPTAVTWDEALVRCARENATLASIRNGEEEKFVRDLQRRAGSTVKTWIGLHDNLYEGRFKWFDGLKFKHGTCVPVNANGGRTENCVAWSVEKPEGCWEDRPCSEQIPYTCRTPVEGKSTYRTEILFKKFRWNPSYKDKNSKAYRDLLNGIRITFKEIFTRQSGQAKGGFRNATVKDVRAVAFQGRPAGLGISIKVQFRSFNADPTLRFQKFLRGSEKILSMDIDKPDYVPGKTGKAGDYCYNSCNHNKHTCAAIHYLQSPSYGYYPGYPAPAPPPYSPNPYTLSYPATVQSMPTITDPYPYTCPIYCSQQSTMDCYTQCNDECCDNRNGKRKARPDRLAALKNTKENFGKSPRLLKKQRQKEGVGNFHLPNGIREKWRNVNEDIETNLRTPGNSREHFTDNLNKTEGSEHWTFDEDNLIDHDQKYRKSFSDTRASKKKAEHRTEDMDPKLKKPYNRRGHFTINLNKTQSSKQSTIDEWDTMNDYLKYKKLLALRQKTDSRSTKAKSDHQQGKLKKEVETSQKTHFNKLNTTSRANENERYTIILNKSAYDSRPSTFDGNGFNENSLKITKAYDTINDVLEHKKSEKAYLKPMSTGLSTKMNAAKKHKYFEKFNGRAESRDEHFGTLINSTQDSKSTFFPNKVKNNKDGYDHESTSRDDLINNVPEPNKSDQLSIKKLNVHSNINMGLIKQHKHLDHLDENPPEAANEHFTTITNKTQESKVSSLDEENNNKYDHENEDPGDLINDVGDAEKSSRIHTLQQLNNLTAMFDDRPTEAANEHLTTTHLSDTRDSSLVKEHNNRYDDQNINADDLIDDEEQELKRSDASPLTLLTANSTNTTSASDDEEGESENESLINANTTSASNDEEGGESENESLINALIAHSTNTSASDEEEEEEGESDKGSLINALTTHSTNTTSASDQEEEENEKGSLVNVLKPMNDELENESLENDEDAISEKQEISRQEEDEKEKEDEDDESNSVREPTDENSETEEVLREPDDDNSESIDNDNAKDRDSDDQRNDGEHDEDEDEDDFYLDNSRKEPSEENLDEEGIQDVGIFGRRKRNKIFKRER